MTICTDCCIGIPFDCLKGHLKDNHGIRTTEPQILAQIDLPIGSIESKDIPNWLETYSTIPIAIEGIPIIKGFGCSNCEFYAKERRSIQNHISAKHQGTVTSILEVPIQRPFTGWFRKCIRVDEYNEIEEVEQEAWQQELNSQFTSSLQTSYSGIDGDSVDIRLMNAFIAKVRYKL